MEDTKRLGKELNTTTESLSRSFSVTEEIVYKDARKDADHAEVYKQYVALHRTFEQIVSAIEQAGLAVNALRDIQQQIDVLSLKNISENAARLEKDLAQVRNENASLRAPTTSLPSA